MIGKKKLPIRILFPFVGDTIGGSHLSTLELIKGLDRNEFEPIVAIHQDGMLISYLKENRIQFVYVKGEMRRKDIVKCHKINTILYLIHCRLYLISHIIFLHKSQIEIVHTNDSRMHSIWGITARIAGIKYVRHQRTYLSSKYLKKGKIKLSSKIRFLIPNIILTISNYCMSGLPDDLRDKTKVIVNPFNVDMGDIDSHYWKKKIVNELNLSDGISIVGFVANLIEQKRPIFFVQVADNIIKAGYNNVVFLIFGELREPMVTSVKKVIYNNNMNERCFLMGSRFPIEPYMATFDVLISPAINEGFGRTLVESMLVGTPVVAADDGGHKEIIQHGTTGLLVQPDDSHAFAEAVMYLLDNPTVSKRMSGAARNWAMENCSVAKHVKKIQGVYKELLHCV